MIESETSTSNNTSLGGKIIEWVDYRLPIFATIKHFGDYRTPRNLSYLWSFGSLAGVALVIQIITGIVLAMHYTPHVDHAFDSVENIMRNVNYGWLLRYTHAVGASMFFMVVYIHILRGMYYGSYKKPRELVWFFGIFIFLSMMATAFMGYVLPWGQMSFWGATVITNLFSALPGIGESIVTWLWGGFSVDNPTLNRFFSLHYLLPFIIFGLVIIHILGLHHHGSSNPTGIEIKDEEKETIPFHPYYTVKDFVGFGIFFLIFFSFVFFSPNSLGHPDNYIPANPMVTPSHIVPEWYFLPFYAILRAVPNIGIPASQLLGNHEIVFVSAKLAGVLSMFGAILILFFLPWLDSSPVRSGRYRPWFKVFLWLFALNFITLGWLGGKPADAHFELNLPFIGSHMVAEWLPNVRLAQFCTLYYFAFFLLILPLLGKYEKPKALPNSITDAYIKRSVYER